MSVTETKDTARVTGAAGGTGAVYTDRPAKRSHDLILVKDSKALLLEYLASIRDPERAASLFADDGAFELPFLRSLGVGARYTGRREIAGLLHRLLKLYPNFAFAPDDIHVLIESRAKTCPENCAHRRTSP